MSYVVEVTETYSPTPPNIPNNALSALRSAANDDDGGGIDESRYFESYYGNQNFEILATFSMYDTDDINPHSITVTGVTLNSVTGAVAGTSTNTAATSSTITQSVSNGATTINVAPFNVPATALSDYVIQIPTGIDTNNTLIFTEIPASINPSTGAITLDYSVAVDFDSEEAWFEVFADTYPYSRYTIPEGLDVIINFTTVSNDTPDPGFIVGESVGSNQIRVAQSFTPFNEYWRLIWLTPDDPVKNYPIYEITNIDTSNPSYDVISLSSDILTEAEANSKVFLGSYEDGTGVVEGIVYEDFPLGAPSIKVQKLPAKFIAEYEETLTDEWEGFPKAIFFIERTVRDNIAEQTDAQGNYLWDDLSAWIMPTLKEIQVTYTIDIAYEAFSGGVSVGSGTFPYTITQWLYWDYPPSLALLDTYTQYSQQTGNFNE